MIRTLRAFFLGRLLREKLLLVAFMAIAVVLWLSSFSARTGQFWKAQRRATADLAEQTRWLANGPAIEAAAKKTASRLNPALTLDGPRLLAAIGTMAAEAGLKNTTSGGGTPPPQTNGQFSIHTLDYTVNRASFAALGKFYEALQQRSPYIGIEQFGLRADAANNAQLNLQLRVSSVEVPK
ncbi:MAG: hypothetical protein EXS32_15460 [Opitutus sp.]|nr:hypothetical protein [Opitutus sp.]